MKHIKLFEEVNISKVRKWPTISQKPWSTSKIGSTGSSSDMYFMYNPDFNKNEIGKYINVWFVGDVFKLKNNRIATDQMVTLKKVDKETASRLYRKRYNPVEITITCPVGAKFIQDDDGNDLYNMRASIRSVDDSSYTIWWKSTKLSDLISIRMDIMRCMDQTIKDLNGDEFLEICLSLGADEESIDYG